MARPHSERHLIERIGWLRAAVLGANDGLVSTASLIVGVAAAEASKGSVVVSGVAGLVAGAMSMAAGEYVSVSSQSDTEKAELAAAPEAELDELAGIYVARGVQPDTARAVAEQLMAHDSLGAHARDELGISGFTTARPIQAALTSAATFAAGAVLPLAAVAIAPTDGLLIWVSASAVVGLAVLGGMGARAGGADIPRSVVRVVFWGVLAMAVTAGIGRLFGTVV